MAEECDRSSHTLCLPGVIHAEQNEAVQDAPAKGKKKGKKKGKQATMAPVFEADVPPAPNGVFPDYSRIESKC